VVDRTKSASESSCFSDSNSTRSDMSPRYDGHQRKATARCFQSTHISDTTKRRESGIRFPALFLTLTFYLDGPYLAGLNLRAVLARVSPARVVSPVGPGGMVHEAVELVTGNGTVK